MFSSSTPDVLKSLQVGDGGEKDYLFSRMFSLLWLVLKATGRMS